MRALAELIMRSRMSATLVVAGTAAVPMLFWLSAAAGSLVLLRRGLNDALSIVIWAMLPAIFWWFQGDPNVALVISGTLILAYLLRAGWSWSHILLCSIPLGLVYGLLVASALSGQITLMVNELRDKLPELMAAMQVPDENQELLRQLISPSVMVASMVFIMQLLGLLALMLGRYWQALLYNPGGFGREFQTLLLPVPVMAVLLICTMVAPSLSLTLTTLALSCTVPLMFSGVALVHGLVAQKKLSRFWLVGMYVVWVMFTHLAYPLLMVLAIVDSLFDFRGLRSSKNGPDVSNGEG